MMLSAGLADPRIKVDIEVTDRRRSALSHLPHWIICSGIAAQGFTPATNLWECYVAGPESGSDPAAWRTELNQPLVMPDA